MATIPQNVILMWPSTHASIPALWTRETTLDGRFIKGWGAQAVNTNGGASTHTHTSAAHSHTLAAHTHTYTIPAPTGVFNDFQTEEAGSLANGTHTHTGTSGAISAGGDSSSDAVTYGAVSNNPPYYDMIFIKAQNGATLPDGIAALWGSGTMPTNWSEHSASKNRFLRGAATSADSGATGGSDVNVHDITHTHTGSAHTHASSTSSTVSPAPFKSQTGTGKVADHTHTVSFASAVATPATYSGSLTTAETVEPLYKKLSVAVKAAGGLKARGLIGMWLGDPTAIPKGWLLCNGLNGTLDLQDYFIKVANDTSQHGNTSGSNTHTHAAQSHSHTTTSHTHSHATIDHSASPRANNASGSPGNSDPTEPSYFHPTFNSDASSPNMNTATTTANISDNQPLYTTVVFIQFNKELASAGMFFLSELL